MKLVWFLAGLSILITSHISGFPQENLTKKLAEYFSEYKLGFSLSHIIGGYMSDDGKFVIEKSIRVTAMGLYSDEQYKLFTDGFKKLFNQESVLVCKQRVETNYY